MTTDLRDYNLIEANKILADLVELTGFDLQDNSRKPTQAYLRAILYKNLMVYNYMNDRQISNWFEEHNLTKDRVSILHAVKKIDVYYLNYQGFRDIYDKYFQDKIKEGQILKSRNKVKKGLKGSKRFALPRTRQMDDALQNLVNSVEGQSKRWELYKMIDLRIKSWEWKNTDHCEIIQGSDGISESVF
jgi:hypothetical protein